MRSNLFARPRPRPTSEAFALQNKRMLKVHLAGAGGVFLASQGSMVAYQGEVDFAYEGSGGMGKMFKKAFTGEGMSLMKVSGSGDVFLAGTPTRSTCCGWRTSRSPSTAPTFWRSSRPSPGTSSGSRVRRCSAAVCSTPPSPAAALAITVHGTPVVLNVDQPTFVDIQSAVLWSTTLQTGVRKTATAGA